MASESYGYLILLVAIFWGATYTYQIVEAWMKRAPLLRVRKIGSTGHGATQKRPSPWRLTLAIAGTLLPTALLVVDAYRNKHPHVFLFVLAFFIVAVAIVLTVVPPMLRMFEVRKSR